MTTSRARLRSAPAPRDQGAIRVTHLIDSLGFGGAEHLLVAYLDALSARGVDARVVVIQERDGNPMRAAIDSLGVPIDTLHIDRLRRRGALDRVTAAIAATDPDIVHTQLEFSNILGTLAARRLGVPSIATLHTIDRPRRWSRDALRFRVMAWVLAHRATEVIAVSDSAADHFRRVSGARPRLVTTLHNGIDLAPFRTDAGAPASDLRHDLSIPDDAPLLVTVAVLRPAKGIDDMLTALPEILAHHPDTHYLVVGGGDDLGRLQQVAEHHGIGHRVHFAGHRSDIPAVLEAADLFVLPSHTEALPTVLIEAMAAGLPIVATEVGGVPEIVGHGVTGLLVPPRSPHRLAEAVTRLLVSPIQGSAMGKAGARVAAERFDLSRQAGRLVAEYRRLIARGES